MRQFRLFCCFYSVDFVYIWHYRKVFIYYLLEHFVYVFLRLFSQDIAVVSCERVCNMRRWWNIIYHSQISSLFLGTKCWKSKKCAWWVLPSRCSHGWWEKDILKDFRGEKSVLKRFKELMGVLGAEKREKRLSQMLYSVICLVSCCEKRTESNLIGFFFWKLVNLAKEWE
jgi:hypothetical protein